jgi:hypothetical protein
MRDPHGRRRPGFAGRDGGLHRGRSADLPRGDPGAGAAPEGAAQWSDATGSRTQGLRRDEPDAVVHYARCRTPRAARADDQPAPALPAGAGQGRADRRAAARSASPPCPTWWKSSVKLGFTVAVESGAGDAANFADDTYRAAGAEVAHAAELWAQPTSSSRCARPAPTRWPAARGRHADRLRLAGAEPRADAAAGRAQGHGAGHRRLPRSCRARRRWTRSPRWPASAATAR